MFRKKTPPCTTCIHDDAAPAPDLAPDAKVHPHLSRRDLIRTYGIRGIALFAAAAVGLGAARNASADTHLGKRDYYTCYSPCRAYWYRCDAYVNSLGQLYYTNCVNMGLVNRNCCAAYGKASCCCSTC